MPLSGDRSGLSTRPDFSASASVSSQGPPEFPQHTPGPVPNSFTQPPRLPLQDQWRAPPPPQDRDPFFLGGKQRCCRTQKSLTSPRLGCRSHVPLFQFQVNPDSRVTSSWSSAAHHPHLPLSLAAAIRCPHPHPCPSHSLDLHSASRASSLCFPGREP